MPFAHSLLAILSSQKGLNKLVLNQDSLDRDLEANWAVVAEAIQTVLRREGYPKPYEALKELTRTNNAINAKSIEEFISNLDIEDSTKEELRRFTPHNYTGVNLI